jgi:hypothetical protein
MDIVYRTNDRLNVFIMGRLFFERGICCLIVLKILNLAFALFKNIGKPMAVEFL